MFNLFKKKANINRVEEYIKAHEKEHVELEAALKPIIEEKCKAKIIIQQIYAQHNINVGESWYILPEYLDSEVVTDLCVFNDAEIASLLKWTQRYKVLDTEKNDLIDKYYSNAHIEGD